MISAPVEVNFSGREACGDELNRFSERFTVVIGWKDQRWNPRPERCSFPSSHRSAMT
jgi:hypothetical protein